MRPPASDVRFTYDDFLQFPDDGKRHELIDGEHFVTASPNTRHQRVLGNLHWLLRRHLETDPRGEVFIAPFDVVFSQFDVVEPDLLYMSHERAAAAQDAGRFDDEIVPVGEVTADESVRRDTTAEKLASLKPVMDPEGTVTAGNAPGVNDGASCVVVCSEEFAQRRGLEGSISVLGEAAGDGREEVALAAEHRY